MNWNFVVVGILKGVRITAGHFGAQCMHSLDVQPSPKVLDRGGWELGNPKK